MISQRTARSVAGRTLAKAWHDRILGLSAEAAFWQLVSTPSLLLALLAGLGYFGRWFGKDTIDRVQENILTAMSKAFTPDVVNQTVKPMVAEVLQSGRADVGVLSLVLAIWAGSSATATFVNTITIAYGMRDQRGAVRSRILALEIYLVSIAFGVVVLPMLVVGPNELPKLFPESARDNATQLIHDAYWPVVVILLLFGLTSLYHLAPPTRLPWRRQVPGALLAMVIFVLGSAALRSYIQSIVKQTHAYGTLATPIATLLFFFVLALGVLLGAEFNAAIELTSPSRRRPRRTGRWRYLQDAQEPSVDSLTDDADSAQDEATGQDEGGPDGSAS